jgi:hypothetical protein
MELIDHWSVQIEEAERKWIQDLLRAFYSQTSTYDTAQLTIELAYKKGFAKGQQCPKR